MERRQLARLILCPEGRLRLLEEGQEIGVRPTVAPLVVVAGRTREHDAGIHRGRAAEDLPAEDPTVVGAALPRMREDDISRVDDLRGPASLRGP